MNYSDPKGSPGKEHHARLVQGLTQLKTVYNPRNVKRHEETKEKQILQLKKRV